MRLRHHFDVATWKIVGKKEISCNVELRLQPEEKKKDKAKVLLSTGNGCEVLRKKNTQILQEKLEYR